jgi:hypothetical protein
MKYGLNAKESKRANAFQNKHYRKHNADRRSITFFPTGTGNKIVIECLVCCEKNDITDYGSW